MTKAQKVNLGEGIIFIILMAYGLSRHPVLDFWTISSIILFIAGAVLGIIARHELAECFSGRSQAKRIVRSGIYSKIRHPVYLAVMIIAVALCLLYRNPVMYALALAALAIQTLRARAEENILARTFGQDYINYKKSTWF